MDTTRPRRSALRALLSLGLLTALLGCDQASNSETTANTTAASATTFQAGGVYSCDSDGEFSVAKVLLVVDGGVLARLYSNVFPTRPKTVNPEDLEIAIGCVPLSTKGFQNWKPVLLYEEPVSAEEQANYREMTGR